jgi:hypothetical protein
LATIADHCRLENVEKKTAGATSFSLGDYARQKGYLARNSQNSCPLMGMGMGILTDGKKC